MSRGRNRYGNPEDEPDFTPMQVRQRVAAFVIQRHVPPEDAINLRARRLRSAIVHTQRALKEHPDLTARQFGWAWYFLQDQMVRHAHVHIP